MDVRKQALSVNKTTSKPIYFVFFYYYGTKFISMSVNTRAAPVGKQN